MKGRGLDTARILERVRERGRHYFPELGGIDHVVLTRTAHRAYSQIYRIAIRDGQSPRREVAVKIGERAEAQFRAMTEMWPHFATHPRWKIPRPLDYLEELGAIVMTVAPGRSVQARLPWLAWVGSRVPAAAADCRAAAGWLRYYHELGRSPGDAPLPVVAKRQAVDESMGHLARHGIDAGVCRRFTVYLDGLADRVTARPCAVSHVHGEFKIDSVLMDDETVTGLDLWGEHRNAIQHDIASFLNSLLLLRMARPVPWASIRALRDAFLDGYFGTQPYDRFAVFFLQGAGLADVAAEVLARRQSVVVRKRMEQVLEGAMTALARLEDGH